jgi:hypothetical protein
VNRFTRRLGRLLATGVVILAVGSCDDLGPSGPRGPGTVQVELVSPYGSEGSAVFEVVEGTGLGIVTTTGGEVYYEHGADATRVVVILDAPGQIGFRLQTENVRRLPQVTLTQVADGNDELRGSLSGYEVELFPLEGEGGAE